MRATTQIRLGAALAGVGVALGAFAAHGMKGHFDVAALQTFETGVRYQLYHALALVACGALADRGRRTGGAALAFTIGIALFSGSLFGLVLLEQRWLGPITPLGGVAFLIGWLLLALAARAPAPAA